MGAENVVLSGLNQGYAMALAALLTYDGQGEAIAGAFGMCGWLPFSEADGGFFLLMRRRGGGERWTV